MRSALHAEWTKLRTLSSTASLLLFLIPLTVAISAAATGAMKYPVAILDQTKLALTGIQLGQAVAVILAVRAICDEYKTGMILITFTAMPLRNRVLAAKATILTGLVLLAGTAAVLGSVLAGRLILPGRGFTPAHGYPNLSLANGSTLRAAVGSVLYLALIALLSLGIATVVRDAAAAVGVVLGLLYLFPIIAQVVTDAHWHRHLLQLGPMTAGLAVQVTTNLKSQPLGPWTGLAVLGAWAGIALLVGLLILRWRDA
jgi:ABC-2 type transport system permease protein